MTEPATPAGTAPLSLLARIIGVVTSPKATFASIAAFPRPMGVLLVVALVIGVGSALPQFTAAGRQAILDTQLEAMARRGPVSPEATAQFERFSAYMPYVTMVSSLIFLPIISLFFTALYWAMFNTVLGGTATFKQVLATVSHSQVIGAIGVLAGIPLMLMRPTATMGGPFNLGALVPMLEQGSTLAKLLTNLSVFTIWAVFVNAIGLAVLYRRKTMGVFITLLIVAVLFAYVGTLFT